MYRGTLIYVYFYSNGSVGVDYLATFNNITGITNEIIQNDLVMSLDIRSNGTFLGNSSLQVSNGTDVASIANDVQIQGKKMRKYAKAPILLMHVCNAVP